MTNSDAPRWSTAIPGAQSHGDTEALKDRDLCHCRCERVEGSRERHLVGTSRVSSSVQF
jgi:hypothetical protein